jgi:hypothetical protein
MTVRPRLYVGRGGSGVVHKGVLHERGGPRARSHCRFAGQLFTNVIGAARSQATLCDRILGGPREVAVKMLGQGASARQQEDFLKVRALPGVFKRPLLSIANRFV